MWVSLFLFDVQYITIFNWTQIIEKLLFLIQFVFKKFNVNVLYVLHGLNKLFKNKLLMKLIKDILNNYL